MNRSPSQQPRPQPSQPPSPRPNARQPPPDGRPSPILSTPGQGRPIVPYAPEPLQVRTVLREATGDGRPVATGIYRIWDAQAGVRCRLCSAGTCNLTAVAGTSVATCIVIVQGEALPGVPPAVAFRG